MVGFESAWFSVHQILMIEKFAPWPFFDEDERLVVNDLLTSGRVNYWTGEEARHFEKEYAAHLGRKHAVAVANGTLALELALIAYDIGPGDEVIVPCRTFIATASCAVMRGAVPVVCDVDPVSQNISAATIEPKITEKTRAIICVHLAGWACDMQPIMELAKKHNLLVIEDCAQSHGAYYRGRAVGSIGHIAAFSFCQDKIISTAGEGGLIVTDDESIFKKCWSYKDHGKDFDAYYHKHHPLGYRWVHESFGTNWRMVELQAAIGRLQLRKYNEWVKIRRSTAERFNRAFAELPALRVTVPPAEVYHSYYKYYVFVRPEKLKNGWSRDRIMEEVSAAGVPCFTGSCGEIYREKAFDITMGGRPLRPAERLPVAKELEETSLMLLCHNTLTETNINDTIRIVSEIVSKATA